MVVGAGDEDDGHVGACGSGSSRSRRGGLHGHGGRDRRGGRQGLGGRKGKRERITSAGDRVDALCSVVGERSGRVETAKTHPCVIGRIPPPAQGPAET